MDELNNVEKSEQSKAKDSYVFGILALALSGACILQILPLVGAVAGIIFGNLSKNTKGEKLGKAGIYVSIICFGLYALGLIVSAIELMLIVPIIFGFIIFYVIMAMVSM